VKIVHAYSHLLQVTENSGLCKNSRCVPQCAPSYFCDLCCPASVLAARRVLHSVPQTRLAIMQQRAFLVVGPLAWNDILFELCSLLMAHPSKFYISEVLLWSGLGWQRLWAGVSCTCKGGSTKGKL